MQAGTIFTEGGYFEARFRITHVEARDRPGGRGEPNLKEAVMKNYIPPPIYSDDLRAVTFLTLEAIAIGLMIYVMFFGLQ